MKLYYFDMTGRAEAIRVMLATGGVDFEDVRFSGAEWASTYKAKSPTGACPFLELDDGQILCQSFALAMYAATQSGHLPSDPLSSARCVEIMACLEEVWGTIMPTFGIQDMDEKIKARQALLAEGGDTYNKLLVIEKLLANSKTEFYLGNTPTIADIFLFTYVCSSMSGAFEGLDSMDETKFPRLMKIRNKVAQDPKVAQYYADKGDKYKSFRA